MQPSHIRLGIAGELRAVAWLQKHGFRIIARNIRLPPGEIDILAHKDGTHHFIEVKTRSSERFGAGTEAITKAKLGRMIQCAQWYASENKVRSAWQIDVINLGKSGINWLPNVTLE